MRLFSIEAALFCRPIYLAVSHFLFLHLRHAPAGHTTLSALYGGLFLAGASFSSPVSLPTVRGRSHASGLDCSEPPGTHLDHAPPIHLLSSLVATAVPCSLSCAVFFFTRLSALFFSLRAGFLHHALMVAFRHLLGFSATYLGIPHILARANAAARQHIHS